MSRAPIKIAIFLILGFFVRYQVSSLPPASVYERGLRGYLLLLRLNIK